MIAGTRRRCTVEEAGQISGKVTDDELRDNTGQEGRADMWKTTTDKRASTLAGFAAGVAGAGSLGFVGAHVALAAALALPLGLLAAAIAVRLMVRGQPRLTE